MESTAEFTIEQRHFLIALLMVVFFSIGASQVRGQPTGTVESVKIAYPSRGVTILPLRIGQVQGFFKQERLEAELIQMRAGITIAALTTGDLDFGAPLDSIIRA